MSDTIPYIYIETVKKCTVQFLMSSVKHLRRHYYQQLQIQQTLGAQPKENESTSLVLSLSFK